MEEWYRSQEFFEQARLDAIQQWAENREIIYIKDDLESLDIMCRRSA